MDMYNMSSALSQGNALTSGVDNLNEQIRQHNDTLVKNAKDAAKNAVAGDKQALLFGGIKDAITEGSALQNFNSKLSAYEKSQKATGFGGFSEVKPSDSDFTQKAQQMGEGTQRDYSEELRSGGKPKPSAGEVESEGGVEGGELTTSEDVNRAGNLADEAGEVSRGARVAGAIGKGVGVIGGLAAGGMDLYEDFKDHKIEGDNIGEKIANIGTIGGAALDMIGLIPGFQLAGVVGAGLQAASGVLEASSEAVHEGTKEAQDSTPAPVDETPQVAQASLAGSYAAQR